MLLISHAQNFMEAGSGKELEFTLQITVAHNCHGNINLATAISIYTRDFHDVILARNVLWESIQHDGE